MANSSKNFAQKKSIFLHLEKNPHLPRIYFSFLKENDKKKNKLWKNS
jgi:hypothetical protein